MKIKTIISSICLMLLAGSCSMEDVELDEVGRVVIEETSMYAEFDLSLIGGGLRTKAVETEAPDNEKTTEGVVNSCYIAAFLGDGADLNNDSEIIATAFYSTYQSNAIKTGSADEDGNPNIYMLGNHMICKVPVKDVNDTNKPKVTFVAIANLLADVVVDSNGEYSFKGDQEGFMANCKTYGDILERKIIKTDPNIFVKFGKTTVSDYKVRKKVLENCVDGENCTSVKIPVYQRTAAILLDEFNVRITTGVNEKNEPIYTNVSDVEVKSVSLLNAVTSTYVGKADPDAVLRVNPVGPISVSDDNPFHPEYVAPTYLPEGQSNPKYESIDQIRFYTYANESNDVNKQTALKVVYTVNGVESTSTFKIKTDGVACVQPGNIYKLYVTITNGTAEGICTVSDFISNTVTGTWEEVTGK